MAVIRIQHSFQGLSGDSKDQYVNTFHCIMGSTPGGALDDMAEELKSFYHDPAPSGAWPITEWMAGQSDTAGARIKMYNLSEPEPRQPIFDEIYSPAAAAGGGNQPFPSEVAVCLSYAAAPVSGVPLARTRGRIYLGPLSVGAGTLPGTNGISRPIVAFREALVTSAKRLANAWAGIDPVCIWAVYSPTSNTSHGVVRWWCDDAWDTQRRRGDPPTSRVEETI